MKDEIEIERESKQKDGKLLKDQIERERESKNVRLDRKIKRKKVEK